MSVFPYKKSQRFTIFHFDQKDEVQPHVMEARQTIHLLSQLRANEPDAIKMMCRISRRRRK